MPCSHEYLVDGLVADDPKSEYGEKYYELKIVEGGRHSYCIEDDAVIMRGTRDSEVK